MNAATEMPQGLEPGVADQLHGEGLTLGELFEAHITEHSLTAEVFETVDEMLFSDQEFCCECGETLRGYCTKLNHLWPVTLRDFDFATEWLDADGRLFGTLVPADKFEKFDHLRMDGNSESRHYAIIRRAEALLRERYRTLIEHLQEGSLVAYGQRSDLDGLQAISRAVWSQRALRIDFLSNELHRLVGSEIDRSGQYPVLAERTFLDWTGVLVSWRDGLNRTAPADLGGRKPLYEWESAYQELVCMLAQGMVFEGKKGLCDLYVTAFERLRHRNVPSAKYAGEDLPKRNPKLWALAGRRR